MSTAELAPIAGSIDNPGDGDAVPRPIKQAPGLPMGVSPDELLTLIRSGVALMFEAQTSGNMNLLRGTFAAPVVGQCRTNRNGLMSGQPRSVAVHLAAGRVVEGHGVVRVHLEIHGDRPDGQASLDRQFWDLQVGAQVTVTQSACPNCGAPVGVGELICNHCGSDVRSVVEVPAMVCRLELY